MTDKAHALLDKLGTIVHGLDAIEGIAKKTLGSGASDAFEALHIIAVIINTLRSGLEDKLTVKVVEDEIKSLRMAILDNDTTADQALRDKFDTSDK